MNFYKHLLTITTIISVLLFTSCQEEHSPVDPISNTISTQTGLQKISIPFGATIDSAKFFINVTTALGDEVTIHRITNSWDEMTVTWNNFGGSFNATSEDSFMPDLPGWYASDITGLVIEWFDETSPNYGLLLKEASSDSFQTYSSKESGESPYLKVWWTVNGSFGYDSTDAFADSYIQSDSGDVNFGDSMELFSGLQDTIETQSLVSFEIELVYTGCTRSKGYWKTHSIYGPAPYDEGWELLGEDSTFFLSEQSNYEVMWTPPSGGNAYYQLAHHYIAVWLNLLNGADPSDIQEIFDEATELFEMYTPAYIGSLKGNNALRQQFIHLKGMLEMFNEGEIGPGKCSESNAEYPIKTK